MRNGSGKVWAAVAVLMCVVATLDGTPAYGVAWRRGGYEAQPELVRVAVGVEIINPAYEPNRAARINYRPTNLRGAQPQSEGGHHRNIFDEAIGVASRCGYFARSVLCRPCLYVNRDLECWRPTGVLEPDNVCAGNVSSIYFHQPYPRPLICSQYTQLPLRSIRLGLHDAKLIRSSFVASLASNPHFGQLLVEDDVGGPSDAHRDQRQRPDEPSGPRRAPGSTVYGAFMLLVGAALLKVALDYTDAPRNPTWLTLGGWGIGLLSAGLIFQATILVLTGHWHP
jgi:hypothetical protein